ncbi:heme lyase CcmF/NrfE family subunit [Inmirania thermothiophila]|uniref:Cytochrome c-type biogenesis protein CcmF n=1 Tax=Inmirania thermothiophila TaxID=1750597 RepID=A0A3N1XS44_9GAMM|nr:heme lyase CcmF/NrfE family subunit [Inmirania thermothiophila]ROR29483.1 cytochrome c-type biogenesis protein CcmF [Inmirania thermothiophila]
MIPELGHFSLILALCLALAQAFFPLVGASRGIPGWVAMARPAALGQWLFVAFAFGALTWSFVANDFSVAYVAANSNSRLPLAYRISAVWGGHEGSLLLWVFILATWTVAVAWLSRDLPATMVARVLAVMGMVAVGFYLFTLLTSNPFERLAPAPLDGRDLNPLLQDPGLVLHPPMLYMGYVGFSVAFAFALSALIGGRLDAAWARWSRPWTTVAWAFLTAGITLGSWWAYYELGWGGWWFWDPVENASFMPWLVGTALMHSLAVTEKRSAFKSWTVLLAIFTFSLSLLGTFLVRSGVLTSVHAFATDPARGLFILLFLGVVVGGSLVLYGWRAAEVRGVGTFALFSRETLLLINNVVLVVVMGTVLLGTVYPLAVDALGVGKISVGPPYFNRVFVPLMAPLMFLMVVAPHVRWKEDDPLAVARRLRWTLAAAVLLGAAWNLAVAGTLSAGVAAALALAAWIVLATLQEVYARATRHRAFLPGLAALPRAHWGMVLGHLGVAVFIVGAALSSAYSVSRDVRMAEGDAQTLGGYRFVLQRLEPREGPNYTGTAGVFEVYRDGRLIGELHAEKRIYTVQRMPMTEAGIDPGVTRDLYVAMGEPLDDGRSWAVRLNVKPFQRWIWLGGVFMVIGGLLAATDRRYRLAVRRQAARLAALGGQEA